MSEAASQDEEHLRLLEIFHYVMGGLAGLFALFPIIHLVVGFGIIVSANASEDGSGPPAFFGWFFVGIALLFICIGLAMAGAIVTTGRYLAQRRRHLFCLVVAGLECAAFPFGTVLGVFTIIVLSRDSVKQLFAEAETAAALP
ncbi:MAG: hypothetical protein ACOCX4_09190 [Planctomycetota bacterium]